MSAITVRYLSPTETMGARMKARMTYSDTTLTVGRDYELEVPAQAREIAQQLLSTLTLGYTLGPGGQLPNGDYVFVPRLTR